MLTIYLFALCKVLWESFVYRPQGYSVILIVSRHTGFPEHELWLTEFVQRYSTRMYTQDSPVSQGCSVFVTACRRCFLGVLDLRMWCNWVGLHCIRSLGAGEMFKSRCEHRIHTNFTPQTNMPQKHGFVVAELLVHQDGRFRLWDLQNMIQSCHFSLG